MIHKEIIPFIEMTLEYMGFENTHFLDNKKKIICFISKNRVSSLYLETNSKELEEFFIIEENELKCLDKNNISIIIDPKKLEIIFMQSKKIVFKKHFKKQFLPKQHKKLISITLRTVKSKVYISYEENGKHKKTTEIEK
jgi:hypothetical protein